MHPCNRTADGSSYDWNVFYHGQFYDGIPGVYQGSDGSAFNPREIDMSNQLKLALQSHRVRMKSRHGELPAYEVPARIKGRTSVHLVFMKESGGPLDRDNFRRHVFKAVIKKSDVPKMRLHDIRHTFASLMLQQGAPVHYVKEQMGHASITTTVDTYGHVMPNSNRNAVNKLDDLTVASAPAALALAS